MQRTARLVSLAAITLSIGACAGPRKGADAGGGPAATTGGTTGGQGAPNTARTGAPAKPSTPAANTAGNAPSGQGARQGMPCEDGKCAPGLTCISYYGIAGPAGPKFSECEIRCETSGKPGCPAGQTCVTIADGPGSVCRPPDM